ncbi:MAG: DUF427 domain-containing protein [Alsobacter sp.]
MIRPVPDPTSPGQESVWDYPRPPALQPSARHVVVRFGGIVIAETRRAWRVLETSHPPGWYLPPDDILPGALEPAAGASLCEWKGRAAYWDVVSPRDRGGSGARAERAAWSYPRPTPAFAAIAGYVALYPGRMESCSIDGEPVRPQEGGFYGGWITRDVAGPFKGAPGTMGW